MTPIIDVLPIDVDFDVVDSFRFIPCCAGDSRVELDVRVQIVLLCEVLKILPSISTSSFDFDSKDSN